jgi:hypothetical protein
MTPSFPRSGIPTIPLPAKWLKAVAKNLQGCSEGHPPYKARCISRSTYNTGCPECGYIEGRVPHHPVVSVGKADLAGEWDHKQNARLPSEVTLGNAYRAWWVCSRDPEHRPWQTTVKSRAMQGNGCPKKPECEHNQAQEVWRCWHLRYSLDWSWVIFCVLTGHG